MLLRPYHHTTTPLLLLLLILPLCLDAVLSLPLLPPDDAEDKTHAWSTLMLSPPLLANLSNSSTSLTQDGVALPLWLDGLPYPLVKPNSRASSTYDTHRFETVQQPEGGGRSMVRPRVLSQYTSQLQDSLWDLTSRGMEGVYMPHSPLSGPHSAPNGYQQNLRAPAAGLSHSKGHAMSHSKRSEGGKIPTMGLGVLSDLRKFFTELRTNLDSVEEVAALSQEQGLPINPEDFLALLAQHEAKVQASKGKSGNASPKPPAANNKLMFGYIPDNQPYAHSGLGK